MTADAWRDVGKQNARQGGTAAVLRYALCGANHRAQAGPPQAHVYIWCLSAHVDWGYAVAAAWRAEPITLLTWKKPGLGAGRFRCNTEHVLVARVGPRAGNPFGQGGRHAQATDGTLFEWPRGRHSEKPQEFYDLVERLSPEPRLEMYARCPRAGWDVWGAEAAGDVAREPLPPRGQDVTQRLL